MQCSRYPIPLPPIIMALVISLWFAVVVLGAWFSAVPVATYVYLLLFLSNHLSLLSVPTVLSSPKMRWKSVSNLLLDHSFFLSLWQSHCAVMTTLWWGAVLKAFCRFLTAGITMSMIMILVSVSDKLIQVGCL